MSQLLYFWIIVSEEYMLVLIFSADKNFKYMVSCPLVLLEL